jgi:hypothetical protein
VSSLIARRGYILIGFEYSPSVISCHPASNHAGPGFMPLYRVVNAAECGGM